jgi:hypothetical protein
MMILARELHASRSDFALYRLQKGKLAHQDCFLLDTARARSRWGLCARAQQAGAELVWAPLLPVRCRVAAVRSRLKGDAVGRARHAGEAEAAARSAKGAILTPARLRSHGVVGVGRWPLHGTRIRRSSDGAGPLERL